MGSAADAAIWAGDLSAVYSELGDWTNADRLNEEAIRLKTLAHVNTLCLQPAQLRAHRLRQRETRSRR